WRAQAQPPVHLRHHLALLGVPEHAGSGPALEVDQPQADAEHRALLVVVEQRVAIAVEDLSDEAQVALVGVADGARVLQSLRALAPGAPGQAEGIPLVREPPA